MHFTINIACVMLSNIKYYDKHCCMLLYIMLVRRFRNLASTCDRMKTTAEIFNCAYEKHPKRIHLLDWLTSAEHSIKP